MKSRIKEEALEQLNVGNSDKARARLGSCLIYDCKAFFSNQPFQNTPLASYFKKCGNKGTFTLVADWTLIDETLEKHKGETYYSLECNPLASKYSDDVVHTMFETVFFGVSLILILQNKLDGFCYCLNQDLFESVVLTCGLTKDKYRQYYEEFSDLANSWLGEAILGTMVTTFRDSELTQSAVAIGCEDIYKTILYAYIIMRESKACRDFLVGLVLFYTRYRDTAHVPVSRALLTASAGITALEQIKRSKELLQDPKCPLNLFPLCLDVTASNPMFPCYKFKVLPHSDIKSRYLFYYQNLNTDNSIATINKNLKSEIPIDPDDYEFFKTVIYQGFNRMCSTIVKALSETVERLYSLSEVTKEAGTNKTQLKEVSTKTSQLEQENGVLRRSLEKMNQRYNTLASENRHLKDKVKELTEKQKSVTQAEGIIAVDNQKTAQLQELQDKLSRSRTRIDNLERQAGDVNALEFEIARLKKQLHNEKALNAELLKDTENLEANQTNKSEQLTQEERDLLAKARVLLILPNFPSLKELKHIMTNSTFTFIPNDCSVNLTPAPSADFCLYSTKMTSHIYFNKLKQMYKNNPDKLVLAHTIGNLAICRIVLTKCYELGIDKLNR